MDFQTAKKIIDKAIRDTVKRGKVQVRMDDIRAAAAQLGVELREPPEE